jgi:uncharacterized membrane protein
MELSLEIKLDRIFKDFGVSNGWKADLVAMVKSGKSALYFRELSTDKVCCEEFQVVCKAISDLLYKEERKKSDGGSL